MEPFDKSLKKIFGDIELPKVPKVPNVPINPSKPLMKDAGLAFDREIHTTPKIPNSNLQKLPESAFEKALRKFDK